MTLILDVTISGELPAGSEVYPSQEYLPDAVSRQRGKQYGKVLSSITTTWKNRNDFRHATMHSQKIGNAIRCIDEWHGRLDEFGTTPIEVYGYVLARNDAIRLPYKKGQNPDFGLDLFSYLEKLDEILDRLNSINDVTEIDGNIHYMIAVLIRGGVFSGESAKSKNSKKKNKNETPENNN